MLLSLLSPALAADLPRPRLDCPMDAVLRALDGQPVAVDPVVLTPPPALNGQTITPPPLGGKSIYGGRMPNHVDSENFTVAWENGHGDEGDARLASEALEAAWAALIEDAGWRAPTSSDDYLLWVVLTRDLSGTGLTTSYPTGEFPGGYPVIYLNPDYSWDPSFFRSLSAHELNHAVQYAYRDWNSAAGEAWYWEASAEWGAELALPDVDAYAIQSQYYSDNPEYRFDSTDDYHQYGMFLLNAWLEEVATGVGGMRDVWDAAAARPDDPWDAILVDVTGLERADIWGGFSGAMAGGTLRESSLYDPVSTRGVLSDGRDNYLSYLGTDYYRATSDATLEVTADDGGAAIAAVGETWGESIQIRAGDIVGITALSDPGANYRIWLTPASPADTGAAWADDTSAVGGAGDGTLPPEQPGGCGCSAARPALASEGAAPAAIWWLALVALVRRR